jgi:hypothetical protein
VDDDFPPFIKVATTPVEVPILVKTDWIGADHDDDPDDDASVGEVVVTMINIIANTTSHFRDNDDINFIMTEEGYQFKMHDSRILLL